MLENNYITGLTSTENDLSGKDIPLSESAGVIFLCVEVMDQVLPALSFCLRRMPGVRYLRTWSCRLLGCLQTHKSFSCQPCLLS